MPTPVLFSARPDVFAGMPYKTQLHLIVPSLGSVVIISANSLVPDGPFDQDSEGDDPLPSHVYSFESVPLSTTPGLLSTNVEFNAGDGVTDGSILSAGVDVGAGRVGDSCEFWEVQPARVAAVRAARMIIGILSFIGLLPNLFVSPPVYKTRGKLSSAIIMTLVFIP